MRILIARCTILIFAATILGCKEGQADQVQSACVDLTGGTRKAAFEGKLTTQLFAGPPNYESIAEGDAEERAFILELASRQCAFDGEFIDRDEKFDRVHVSGKDDATMSVLRAAIGREVVVKGEAFGSHTGHHHAPVVILAEEVTVRPQTDQ